MLRALQRVRDFGMELHAVEAARFIRHRRERHVVGEADSDETRRQLHRRDRRGSSRHRAAPCPASSL